jgi:glyoxylase-like metal-dependent hydrolase (beta-lactamase superfamily II)
MACGAALMFSASVYAQTAAFVKKYNVGTAEVWAIADSSGERNLDIFDNVDAKVLKKYAPSGKVPSAIMTYLIKSGEDLILIDTGFGKGLMDGLKEINVKPEDITLVLITHMHGDHIGGLVKNNEKAFPNAAVKIGKIEYDFWLSDKSSEKFPLRKSNFDMAKRTVSVYGDSVEVFNFDDYVADGIKSLDASGHTPGQSAFLLESNGEKILFVADIVHAEALQFARPDISSRYDMDTAKSAKAREKYFKMAAEENIPVAGAHISYPGIGKVTRAGRKAEDGYVFTHK